MNQRAEHAVLAFRSHHRTLAAATLLQCALASGGCGVVYVEDAPSNTVVLDVVESAAMAQSLEAPDYALDASGLALETDVNNIVQSVTGGATLTAGLVPGDGYIVVEATGLDSYAELDGAYLTGEEQAVAPTIPAAEFALVGDDLTTLQQRTLIVAAATSGIRSYQAFEITFHAAP